MRATLNAAALDRSPILRSTAGSVPFHAYKLRDPHGVQSVCAVSPISVRCDDFKLLSHPARGMMSGTISYGGTSSLKRHQDNPNGADEALFRGGGAHWPLPGLGFCNNLCRSVACLT
jgi:hypothetical protein